MDNCWNICWKNAFSLWLLGLIGLGTNLWGIYFLLSTFHSLSLPVPVKDIFILYQSNFWKWNSWQCRRSCPEMFCEKGVFENFSIFTGKHLCQSFFLIQQLYQKETPTQVQVFSRKYWEIFIRTPILKNIYNFR